MKTELHGTSPRDATRGRRSAQRPTAAAFLLVALSACIPTGDKPGSGELPVVPPDSLLPLPDGTFVPVPESCRGPSPSARPPYTVTFKVSNPTDTTVFYRDLCTTEFAIGSCAKDFKDDLTARVGNGCACELRGSCPVGGPCPSESMGRLSPGETHPIVWSAVVWRKSSLDGIECVEPRPVPPGDYEIRLPVYGTQDAATAGTPVTRVVRKSFSLPAPGDMIELLVSL